ncbi:MAG TPA: hypothetical protein VGN88_10710 [Phycisphaerae bacterium]|jgi:hypothetical protein
MGDSSTIEWLPRLGEQFIYNGRHYDLAKAKDLIKATPRAIEPKPLALFKSMYYEAVKIDWDKAEKTDVAVPVIVVTEEGKLKLVDGWHRYAKALRTRLTEIPTVALSEEETKLVVR